MLLQILLYSKLTAFTLRQTNLSVYTNIWTLGLIIILFLVIQSSNFNTCSHFHCLQVVFCLTSPGPPSRVLTGPNYWVFKCSVSPDSSLIASVCNLDTVSRFNRVRNRVLQVDVWLLAIGGSCTLLTLAGPARTLNVSIKEHEQACMWGELCSYLTLNLCNIWNIAVAVQEHFYIEI